MNIEHSDSSQLLLAKYNIQNDFIVTEMILRVFCHRTWIDFTISFIKNLTSRLWEEPVTYTGTIHLDMIKYQLAQTGISYTRTWKLWWCFPQNYQKQISLFFHNWSKIVFLLHILWPTVYYLRIYLNGQIFSLGINQVCLTQRSSKTYCMALTLTQNQKYNSVSMQAQEEQCKW